MRRLPAVLWRTDMDVNSLPIHEYARAGKAVEIRFFLKHGSDSNLVKLKYQGTPLLVAASAVHLIIMTPNLDC